ncbi:MAG: M48 family metallopeptidase [Betaproteobacteria bacterium]
MEHRLRYGEELIPYRVRRRASRHPGRVAIHVESDGRVLVDAPRDATDGDVRKALSKRASWIHRHVAAARRRHVNLRPREYVSGETLFYLGRRYRLKVLVRVAQEPCVRLRAGYIEVTGRSRNRDSVRLALKAWYLTRAKQALAQRLKGMAESLRWLRTGPEIRYQTMRRQWGSCSPAGRLLLNPMLVKAPPDCIDYVLLHELCHFREHNHGRRFYALLDRHMVDWRERKARLDNLAEQILA